jgi:hypothetical protein
MEQCAGISAIVAVPVHSGVFCLMPVSRSFRTWNTIDSSPDTDRLFGEGWSTDAQRGDSIHESFFIEYAVLLPDAVLTDCWPLPDRRQDAPAGALRGAVEADLTSGHSPPNSFVLVNRAAKSIEWITGCGSEAFPGLADGGRRSGSQYGPGHSCLCVHCQMHSDSVHNECHTRFFSTSRCVKIAYIWSVNRQFHSRLPRTWLIHLKRMPLQDLFLIIHDSKLSAVSSFETEGVCFWFTIG